MLEVLNNMIDSSLAFPHILTETMRPQILDHYNSE